MDMATNKVSYANLKLKPQIDMKEVEHNGVKYFVDQYLPVESKYDLVMVTLQKSKENGYYNPVKLDMYFHLNLVYMYTNITFTEKQREDEARIYDCLVTNGVMDAILSAMNKDEYDELLGYVEDTVSAEMDYNKSIGAVVGKVINDLPTSAAAAAEIMENFNPEQFKNVIDFARAANGGRDINLNKAIPDQTLTPEMESLLAPAT